MCSLPTKWGGTWAALPNLLPNVWPYLRHIFPSDYTDPKNLKTDPILINSHIYWVNYQCAITAVRCVITLTTKGQPVKNKHHCKYNPYLSWFIFPFVQRNQPSRNSITSPFTLPAFSAANYRFRAEGWNVAPPWLASWVNFIDPVSNHKHIS